MKGHIKFTLLLCKKYCFLKLYMYKQRKNKLSKTTGVVGCVKKVTKISKSKKIPLEDNLVENPRTSEVKSSVNENIHFHQDVPEEVQEFIKKISSVAPQKPKSDFDQGINKHGWF